MFVRVLMLAWSLISLGLEVFQLSREGVSKYFLDGWNWIDIASIAGVMSSVGLEWMKHNHLERLIAALTVTILGWKVLFHLRGVERTSFLVTMSCSCHRPLGFRVDLPHPLARAGGDFLRFARLSKFWLER